MARRVMGGLGMAVIAATVAAVIGGHARFLPADYCICDAWWSCWVLCLI